MNFEVAIQHLNKDMNLAPILGSVPPPVFSPVGNVYYALLESIVSQQLSVKIADLIFNRFLDLYPDRYPHPHNVLATDNEALRSVGLSYQKASYLKNVADFSVQNNLETHDFGTMTDDEIIAFLCQIKGVGKWTTEMLLIFTIGREDVFPVDDLGIQQAMARLFGLNETGKDLKKRMLELSEPWKPYRTTASRYLWKWKDGVVLQKK